MITNVKILAKKSIFLFIAYTNFHVILNPLSINIKENLVSTLVFPIIDYLYTVYNDMSKFLSDKIDILHNQCLRFIYRQSRRSLISNYRA